MARAGSPRPLTIATEPLTAEDVLAVAAGADVRIGAAARARIAVSRAVLLEAVERGDAVYGSTRRLGAGADDAVDEQAAFQLQVIRNHAGAIGDAVDPLVVRAAMTVRLAQFALGGSGVRAEVADALVGLLTTGVVPFVPDRGSVGMADLALNAAVAQVVIGEGAVLTEDGAVTSGAEALAAAGLTPLELETHEALSLLNTNTFTLGSAVLAGPRLDELAEVADRTVALALEAAAAHRASGDLGPYSATVFADVEGGGAWRSAMTVRELLQGSFLHDAAERRTQDELSFRCAPQVHGALAERAEDLVDATDDALLVRPENPLIDVETRTVVPNGNFASPDLVIGLEAVRVALTHVGRLSARRTAVLSALARPLRAEGRAGIPGLLAYTGAERLNDLRRLAAPVSLDDVVLSEVEDYATWGWTAARTTHDAIDAAADLLAIEALHAASLLRGADLRLGAGTGPLIAALARVVEHGGGAEELVRGAADVLAGV
ncbi:aromatic amino acid lyase [Amnibacterium kyonggiense]|uniref:Histidine ammonia-lyase n=1 Tax=Amnibacterium kyonggiense TaxID=595671 RepID=A0A4R7FKV7_9MICO|nr:aromatic amino acid lyase [Amnibacterium kyonggiense]TDS76988.1 histidine ammonia-lyase [Amnibacterium kyonggiense]